MRGTKGDIPSSHVSSTLSNAPQRKQKLHEFQELRLSLWVSDLGFNLIYRVCVFRAHTLSNLQICCLSVPKQPTTLTVAHIQMCSPPSNNDDREPLTALRVEWRKGRLRPVRESSTLSESQGLDVTISCDLEVHNLCFKPQAPRVDSFRLCTSVPQLPHLVSCLRSNTGSRVQNLGFRLWRLLQCLGLGFTIRGWVHLILLELQQIHTKP